MERTIGAEHAARLAQELFVRYGDEVLLYLRHLVGNDEDANDLRQDVFVKAQNAARRGDDVANYRSWLFRVAHNRAMDHLRRRRLLSIFVLFEGSTEAAGEGDDRAAAIAAWAAIDRLPVAVREAIVLRYRWQLTPAEIGAIQKRSEGAVRAEISRALRRLQRELGVSER